MECPVPTEVREDTTTIHGGQPKRVELEREMAIEPPFAITKGYPTV